MKKLPRQNSTHTPRPSQPTCEKFLRLRSDPTVSDEQFANAVISLSLFETKIQLVAKVQARKWPSAWVDDAMQDAAVSVYFYLANTRGSRFSGTTDDAFGGWLYHIILHNAEWALTKIARGEKRRKAREIVASRPEYDRPLQASQFERTFDRVLAAIKSLPFPLSIIGYDLHYGVPVKETAQTCQLSERRVFELRKKVIAAAMKLLEDMP